MALPTLEEILKEARTVINANSSLSFFGQRVSCAQAGFFEEGRIKQPNLVISPTSKRRQTEGSRLTAVRDEVITVTFYAYQTLFGTEKGLFGDASTNFKGITEIGEALEAFLITNKLTAKAIPDWQGTEYPNYFERNFEQLSEVRVTIAYRIRGT